MTRKQRAFIWYFFEGPGRFKPTRAARYAGYAWPQKQGWVLYHHPKIRPAIDAEMLRRFPPRARGANRDRVEM
ncbi:hypothetical protein [Paludisphaera mucosa]|uniref:Uncharacterized protein n=1 Tax=Paludisphaera mucosa TaxID=3030827 RepID=A0ABT6FF14_9BACT|nr:hypothetical protein [Paludisphaera mucosa]MDG3006079.1 hypothetical protein [Paludisphaera mucosa]